MTAEIAALGIKVDSSGVQSSIDALEQLASKGPRVESAMSGIENAANKTGKSLKTLGEGSGKGLEEIGRVAPKSADGLGMVSKTAEDARKSLASMSAVQVTATESSKGMSKSQDAAAKSAEVMGKATDALAGSMKLLGGAVAGISLAAFIKDSTLLAARFETMGVVMGVAGNNAGYTRKQMDDLSKSLQQQGISMLQSRNSLTQLATANIDLAKASGLARAAQDLAVVGNINSSEALARMIQGIKAGEVEILRTLGLNVSFEASYKKLAQTLGVSSESLDENQKMMARTNAVLEGSVRFAGIYEESMGTAGKAITSLTRYWEDFKVQAGDAFLPTLATAVFAVTDALKVMNKEIEASGQATTDVGKTLSGVFKTSLETVTVLGANVAYVFKAIGLEIGGLAAQAGAVAKLDFKGAAEIGRMMKQDAETNRKAIDKFSESVLTSNAAVSAGAKVSEEKRIADGKAAKAAEEAAAKTLSQQTALTAFTKQYGSDVQKAKIATDEWKAKLGGLWTPEMEAQISGASKRSAAAAKTEETAYTNLIARIKEKIAANTEEIQNDGRLNDAGKLRIQLQAQLDAGSKNLTAAHRASVESQLAALDSSEKLHAEWQAGKKQADDYAKSVGAVSDSADKLEEEARALEASNAAFGQSRLAIMKETQAREENRLAALKRLGLQGEMTAALEREIAARDKVIQGLGVQGYKQANAQASELLRSAQDMSAAYQDEQKFLGMSNLERNKAIALQQVALKYAKQIAEVEKMSATTDAERAEKQKALDTLAQAQRVEGEAAVSKTIRDEWQKTTDQINQSLTDALMRGFESGKDFAKNMRDTIKNMFSTLVLRPIISAALSPISGGIQGLMGGGAAGAAGGGGAGSLMNLASLGSNAFSLYNGGLAGWVGSGVGSIFGTAAGNAALGTTLGLGSSSSIAAANAASMAGGGSGVLGMGSAGTAGTSALAGAGAFAAVAAVVLNALGAFKSERKIGGGLMGTLGSGSISPWEEWREGGTLFSGPSYSTMNPGEEIARARARLEELQSLNASGNIGDPQVIAMQQATVDRLEATYGELVKSTAAQSKVIQSAYDAMRKSAIDMAGTLGLSSDAARNFTTQLGGEKGLNFEGLKPEEQQAKLAEALATANNEIAQQLIGTWVTTTTEISRVVADNVGSAGENVDLVFSQLNETITNTRYIASEYAKDGEKAIDTLTRLSNSLSTVNTIWDQLGYTLLDASLKGADAASRIAEAFGGLEAMASTTGSFFQNFYGEGERRDALERQLQAQFDKLDLQLPDIDATNAREQYRALAEAQDRNTEEGLKAYVALLQLSGAFAELTTSAADATTTLKQQSDAAYSILERAIAERNNGLKRQLDAAKDVAGTIGNIFDILHKNVRDLYGEVDTTRAMQSAQGSTFIEQALATAKKTGYLPDADKLAEAISAVREGINSGVYTSQFAEDRDRLVLAGRLSGLEAIAGKQLTDAQKTVKALEEQIEQGTQILDYWSQQIEISTGTYEGIMSVEQAIQNLQSTLNPSIGKPGGANTVGGGTSPASGTGTIPRAGYGAEEALTSFEKFKSWYTGLKSNADPSKLMGTGYEVPDWLKVSNFGADDYTDKELFGSYLFFKNNPQYAQDYQQIIDTGKSSYATDGSTLLRTDLSKLPSDIAAFYGSNKDALAMTEGFGLDPVLAYQLYNTGAAQFGLDQSKQSFTEWLQNNKWTPEGIVANNNVLELAQQNYPNYKLPRWDTDTGNIIDTDGTIYSTDGKRIGTATQAQLDAVYGPGYKPVSMKPNGSAGGDDYLSTIRTNIDSAINAGWSAQQLLDAVVSTGTSLQDVATAYGISVDQVRENLAAGGATNIPFYETGTNMVPNDGLAYLHKGEAVIPKAYNPAMGGSGCNEELLAEIRALKNEVAILKDAAVETTKNTRLMPQMANQFDSVTTGGNVMRNKAVA